MLTRIKLGLIAILSFLATSLMLSQKADPSNSTVYGLKRAQEKLFINLTLGAEAKADYLSFLLDRRLSELIALSTPNKSYYLWSASLRYSATAGNLTEIIESHGLKNQVSPTIEKFQNHKRVIRTKLDTSPGDFAYDDWKFLVDAENYLTSYIDELSGSK